MTPSAAEQSDSVQGPVHRKDRLIQEKRLVEVNSAHSTEGLTFCSVLLHHWCQMHAFKHPNNFFPGKRKTSTEFLKLILCVWIFFKLF